MEKLKIYEALYGAPGAPDSNHGVGGKIFRSPSLGTNQGGTSPIYQYSEIGDNSDYDDDEDLIFDDDMINLSSKDLDIYPRQRVDLGAAGDVKYYATPGVNSLEEQHTHTTTAVKGMVPFIQRPKTNVKGPSMNGMASAQYIRNKPGRIHGTEKGTSRAPAPLKGEKNLNPIFSLSDMLEKEELAYVKFQNEQNKIKKIINEFLKF